MIDHVWYPYCQHQNPGKRWKIRSAKGAWLVDHEGHRILDTISSWWVITHGHRHPDLLSAWEQQLKNLDHVMFASFVHEPALELAEMLCSHVGANMARVFFSDNGSTAVEIAIKMALQFWINQGQQEKTKIMALNGGYHGDTFGAMAAGMTSGFFTPFSNFCFDVQMAPVPSYALDSLDIDVLEQQCLKKTKQMFEQYAHQWAALILEPLVQGAVGMRMMRPSYVDQLIALARQYDILIIFDEVMTGFGRTGTMFACHQLKQSPDILCLAKGITGGLFPLAVTMTTEKIFNAFLGDSFHRALPHGHTFTAHPVGCALAIENLKMFERYQTREKIRHIEQQLVQYMIQCSDHPLVSNVRVMGCIAAFDLSGIPEGYGSSLSRYLNSWFIEQGFNIRPLGNTIYVLLPYCVTDHEIHQLMEVMMLVLNHTIPAKYDELR